jgi:hypothetical protein
MGERVFSRFFLSGCSKWEEVEGKDQAEHFLRIAVTPLQSTERREQAQNVVMEEHIEYCMYDARTLSAWSGNPRRRSSSCIPIVLVGGLQCCLTGVCLFACVGREIGDRSGKSGGWSGKSGNWSGKSEWNPVVKGRLVRVEGD